MSLAEGTKLGAYEIVGQIGAGGMGEVYLATDTKLGRDVAIKTLPASLADDPDRLARFEREAKLLATLNHAHIASVYSLDEHEATLYIAMELVEGETLETKLKAGALPVEEALRLALQIAEALEAAHDKGVIHRDLKPANVMVSADGVIKVLDFGLAKAFSGDPAEASPAHSPSLSVAMTQQGLVLGTAAYMSPEQASGQATDQRADVWAFGVVLYEMLTGLPLFSGESVPHILAAVLQGEPDWNRLPGNLHPLIRHTLERCLTKKPRNRYHSIADARVDIQQVLSDPDGATPESLARTEALPVSRFRRFGLPAGLMALAAAVTGVAVWYPTRPVSPEPEPVNRFEYVIPGHIGFRSSGRGLLALARDGRHFVIRADSGLYVRRMGELEMRSISGTDQDVYRPFFSPDGQSVAYSVGQTAPTELKSISITGGAPVILAAEAARPFGASWESDGTVFWGQVDGIARVSVTGGTPEVVIRAEAGERVHGPQRLPGGDLVLFTSDRANNWDTGEIVVASLTTGERTVVWRGGSDARYLPTGHLVYAYEDELFGVAFDLDTLTVSGDPVSLVQGLVRAGVTADANYSISDDGTLVYLTGADRGGTRNLSLVWVDRNGNDTALGMEPCDCQIFDNLALSPDGTRLAMVIDAVGDMDIWIWSFASETLTRLTFEPGNQVAPVWTSDSDRIVYVSVGEGILARAADGTGTVEPLLAEPSIGSDGPPQLQTLSLDADGNVVFRVNGDIHVLNTSDGTTTPLLAGSLYALSPESRFLAYTSSESGRNEIYVRPYPDVDSGRWRVSTAGGHLPKWSADGSRLYFLSADFGSLMETVVETEPSFSYQPPVELFSFPGYPAFNVSADGEQFLMLKAGAADDARQPRVIIVQNWIEELKRLVPVN